MASAQLNDARPVPVLKSAVIIRPARADEADLLTELAIRSKAHWGYSEDFMRACSDELTVRPGKDRQYFCIESDGKTLGFCGLERLDDSCIELGALFVEPDAMGRGVGKSLVEHATDTARQLGAQTLLIQGDPNATAFYLAAGARRVGNSPSGSIPGRRLPLFEIDLLT